MAKEKDDLKDLFDLVKQLTPKRDISGLEKELKK